mgnify:CR=1 FL=1
MLVSLNDFLQNNTKYLIYTIFGEEEFLREEAQNKILGSILKTEESKYNFDSFDGETSSLNKIIDVCRSYPMMSDYRYVLIKRFEKLFSGRQSKKIETNSPFSKYLESPSQTTILIINAEIDKIKDLAKLTSNNELTNAGLNKLKDAKFPFNILLQKFGWIEFPKVYENEFPAWIEKKITSHGKKINRDASQILALQVRSSLRDLNSEIDKLILYVGDKKEITEDDIFQLSGTTKDYNVFELQKAIAQRNLSKSIFIINKILAVDRQEMLIITILVKFFSLVFKLADIKKIMSDESLIAKEMGMLKWQIYDYMSAANSYKPEEIDRILILLADTDFKLKSGFSDNIFIMQELITKIIKG